jgi:hypothetical protein
VAASTIAAEIRRDIDALAKEGITCNYVGRTGKSHLKFLTLFPNGKKRTLITPCTPSDYRTAANMIALARRWAREPG